jgi:hypothetical protein
MRAVRSIALATAFALSAACGASNEAEGESGEAAFSAPSVIPARKDARFSDSHLYTPDFHLFQDSSRLADLRNRDEVSMICGPTALAHAMRWQRLHRPEGVFPTLSMESDLDRNGRRNSFDLIRHFVEACGTTMTNGTRTGDLGRCAQAYYRHSRFREPITFMVAPNASTVFPEATLPRTMRAAGAGALDHTPTFGDIRKYLEAGYSVVMSFGWYHRSESGPRRLVREGGHFVNVYGYNFDRSRPDRMQLKIVNPAVDYTKERKPGKLAFDMAEMKPIASGGYAAPDDVKSELRDIEGESTPFFGLEENVVAGVERLLVFLPEER